MKLGQDNARQTDTHNLTFKIIDMMFHGIEDRTAQGLSGLCANVKTTRGFNNDATGRLLCPVNMDWGDAECVVAPNFGTAEPP
jgi:Family of unknown function (DUF6698)